MKDITPSSANVNHLDIDSNADDVCYIHSDYANIKPDSGIMVYNASKQGCGVVCCLYQESNDIYGIYPTIASIVSMFSISDSLY